MIDAVSPYLVAIAQVLGAFTCADIGRIAEEIVKTLLTDSKSGQFRRQTFGLLDTDNTAFLVRNYLTSRAWWAGHNSLCRCVVKNGAGLFGIGGFKGVCTVNMEAVNAATQPALCIEQKGETLNEQVDL